MAFKIPKKIGTCADRLYKIRQERFALQNEAKKLKEQEIMLENYIIDELPKSDASGVAGKIARTSVETKQVPSVEDWPTFYRHVKRTGNFELLSRSLSGKAVRERWENGKDVPGVGSHTVVSVSLNKL